MTRSNSLGSKTPAFAWRYFAWNFGLPALAFGLLVTGAHYHRFFLSPTVGTPTRAQAILDGAVGLLMNVSLTGGLIVVGAWLALGVVMTRKTALLA